MKKKQFFLLTLCAVGGVLVGYNAGKLNDGLSIVWYASGLAMVSLSVTMLGMQIWKKK